MDGVRHHLPGVRLTIAVPAAARVGEHVPICLRVENLGAGAVDLYLRGRSIAFDVIVERPDGEVVWRRLDGEIIEAIVQLRSLDAGEMLTLEAHWDQRTAAGLRAPPGDYRVRGLLPTDAPDALETERAPLHLISAEA